MVSKDTRSIERDRLHGTLVAQHMPGPEAPRQRRALSHVPGDIRVSGDPASATRLRAAWLAAREREPRLLTHGFHSYPARFHPLTVRSLLAQHARPDALVCDPFCGSGTTLVEALIAGARGVGSDLNPLAIELARVKALAPTTAHLALPDELVARTKAVAEESLARVKTRARTKTSGEAWDDPQMYAPHVFRELVGLRELLDEPPVMGEKLRRAALLCFSAILIKVSRQPSETGAGVQERTIGKGLPTRLFSRKAEELAQGWRELFAAAPANAKNPSVYKADARRLRHLADGAVDIVVTSPPYLGTYDYAEHHVRRLGWLGLKAGALEHNELGARRRSQTPKEALSRWQEELDAVLAELARVLAPSGAAFIVIGDSRVGPERVPGDLALRRAAEHAKLRVVAAAAESRRGARIEEYLLELRHR
jgi:DNA modification methylase